ncbi:MAG: hypothetical protein Q4A41_02595, partial [Bacillota bacterium]|nr:hypothetical protein [Bacillota bacterium]
MKYGRKFIGWMIVSALAASTLAGCSDSGAGGVQSGTQNVVTVTTQPLSSESSSTSGTTAGTSSSDATVTSTSTSSQSAVKIGALVGDGTDVFKHWHGGIIGKRPASGVVTDLKISNEDYTYIRDLGQSIGLQPVYRIPQINLKSDAARAFNEYIKKRAEIDLSGVARQIKGSEQGLRNDNIKGLIYMDYAVNETPRYISIVLYKLNNMTPQNPWMRVDAFVYDKNSSKVLKLSDLLDDFGVAHTDGIAALEALYPKHNIELKKGDSGYTYMQEYAFYLQRLWGVFYDMNSNHGVRGYEEYFDIEGFDWSFYAPLALYVAHEDGKDVLRLIHRDARITGVDDSTGNISYERKILDESFEAIRSGERKVNKVFAAYAGDAPEEVLGIVAYLGSE